MLLRNTSSDTTAETRNVNQFIDEGGSRHSIGLYSYETVSNKRSSNNRYNFQMVGSWSYAPLVNRRLATKEPTRNSLLSQLLQRHRMPPGVHVLNVDEENSEKSRLQRSIDSETCICKTEITNYDDSHDENMIPKHAIRSKTKGVGGDNSIFTFVFRSPVKSVFHERSLLGEARVLKTPPATQPKAHAFL